MMLLYITLSYSKVFDHINLVAVYFVSFRFKDLQLCEAAEGFSFLLKIHPVAPETVTSQKKRDSEKETISKSLSILAESSALKYFSQD